MKAYASFDVFLDDQPPKIQAILRRLRTWVRSKSPGLEEAIKWGNGCWLGPKGPVVFAHCEPDHVQFGFFQGASLDDPRGLLEGKARYVRHVKLVEPSDVDMPGLAGLLKQAARA